MVQGGDIEDIFRGHCGGARALPPEVDKVEHKQGREAQTLKYNYYFIHHQISENSSIVVYFLL